ncbi:MAG: ABC transporter ATP-binding protein [Kiritimatiellaeota bacterium]|nr:ABC transporter ATP-binding protein [Kiritimatiellota bacterium]
MKTGTTDLAITARGLVKKFAANTAIDGLDLDVQRGEMFGLVGPDGAGKSTAIRLLCGLLKPDAGTASVLGFDLLAASAEVKRRIGYLSQNFTLYGDLTIDENIEFFAELHGVGGWQARRDELLAFTRLTPFRRRLSGALSGGMKKKLALACTLIHTPQLIFLDEPSTGVDPVSRGEFWSILSGILAQGVTILMTTPYLDEAERCHRVALLHRGRVMRSGTPAEIRAGLPGRLYRLEAPSLPAAYRALAAGRPVEQLVLYGDRLHFWSPTGAEQDVRAAVAQLDAAGLGPARFQEITPSLEDVFIGLLGAEGVKDEKPKA